MNQLGDLEKILSAAKEIGENFQKELSTLQEENELLKVEIEELREDNKSLREENEKIYLEMNNLRTTKEEINKANEAFSTNINHLVTQLEDNHKKTMEDINHLLTEGLQDFVVEYMKKFQMNEGFHNSERYEENDDMKISDEQILDSEISDEVETLDDYSKNEVAVEPVNNAVATRDGSKKNKMQYAAFYAEETGMERDAVDNNSKKYR